MPDSAITHAWASPQHRRTVNWVVAIAAIAIVFDGYDLVVYGTILPALMADPTQLGEISATQGGALGSYALIGVLVGALVTGAVGDYLGRRKMMLINIAWFSIGMGAAAMSTNITMFGFLRFLTGIGVGGLVATAGAVVAEFAPPGKRNLYNAIVYSGVPAGGVLASVLAIALRDVIGWRGLFWIGALPIVFLLPLAIMKLPESPKWLVARGKGMRARAVCERTGIPMPEREPTPQHSAREKVGFAALASRHYLVGTALLGAMSFAGLLLTYGLNTWLPKIMQDAGYNAKGSLSFLLVLNGGAIVGGLIASKVADGRDPNSGPKAVIATTFVLAAFALAVLTLGFPLPVLLAAVAVAGTGT
ncbi:MAG: MFS transporter, partial [Aldersonia sp.]|nr:MFS transporter [Aldersonia sp.]